MVRLARAEVFDSAEIAIAHVYNRTVRRCFLISDLRSLIFELVFGFQ